MKDRPMRVWQTNPFEALVLTRGEGCKVWDQAGNSYLDLISGTWCNVLGYDHPQWKSAICQQTSRLVHTAAGFVCQEIEEALSKLAEILPPALNRAVFLNTGSEAVELALKMARAASGADRIIVIERSYYGATTYALALSEAGRHAGYLPPVDKVVRLPAPDCRRCPMEVSWPCHHFPCLDPLRDLADRKTPVAALVYEPVLANGGVLVPPPGYGSQLRILATECNALLIAEEVTTGIGRTGRWFGFQHDNIVPDLVVIGKAIGAGLPVSVVVTTDDVEARCQGTLTHVQSHQNDPFSGHVSATVISILQDEKLVEGAARRGKDLLDGLKKIQFHSSLIADVRGKGLMVGVELIPHCSAAGPEMAQGLLKSGFIVNYQPQNSCFRLFPPYVISRREIDSFLQSFENILANVAR